MLTLRPYQNEAVAAIEKAAQQGQRRVLVSSDAISQYVAGRATRQLWGENVRKGARSKTHQKSEAGSILARPTQMGNLCETPVSN